jgi:phospholipase/lecithinase/hemolysin
MLRALALSLAALGAARAWPYGERIRNLVQFGDSYTDSTVWIATNGTSWGEYLAGYAGLELYNFAYSGATCDNKSTPRTFPDIKVECVRRTGRARRRAC